ncbi:MAG: endonuclease MutS2 [Eubacterium sp.]|nr:endonuclease MutS2 [Eubacterium sp.]
MNKKVLHTLEYDKIIDRLVQLADSEAGKTKAKRIRPLSDKGAITSHQAFTSAAFARILKGDKPRFSGLKDIRPALKPLEKGRTLGIRDLLNVNRLLEITKNAIASDEKLEDYKDVLSGQFASLLDFPDLRREITRCIISEDEIADDASPTLKSIRRDIAGMDGRIREQLNKTVTSSQSMLRDSIITQRNGRYCLQVKSEYKSSFPGIVHDQSSTGSTFFIEPMAVVELGGELAGMIAKEQAEIEKILADLSNLTAPYITDLEKDYLLLADLDFIFAKGELAKQMRASEPIFQGDYIDLRQARHPLIDPKSVVPIDVSLGKDYDLMVITGPNTGGKTVTLKTIGLLTLMGQAGLHIPAADRSHLRVYDEVFADIGDEQSIEQSLSTFSSHMTNTVSILKKANTDSLTLFDELGAGTDPTEGAALAIAILDHLHQKGIHAVATTHYSELKLYALDTDGVENASCEFDVASLKPTYRLLVGIPGKSNAFAIAGKLGLDKNIITEADKLIASDAKSFEDVVSGLEQSKIDAEREREKAIRFRENAESYKQKLEDKNERLEQSKDKILRQAHEEARIIVEKAKEVADDAIRKYNKWMQDPDALKAMEKERQSLRDNLNKTDEALANYGLGIKKRNKKAAKKPEELEPGDIVMVLSMGVQGTVATLPNRGKCFVNIGILRSEVDLSDLEFISEGEKKNSGKATISKGKNIGRSKAMSVHTEINLIGKTVAEAIPELEKYLDDAVLAGLSQVRIIHGMGTGALRNAVSDSLKSNPTVDSFRPGEQGEGGYGATVAFFKK